MATKVEWDVWRKQIRKWMREHKSNYQYPSDTDRMIDDAISACGNPYNLDPSELGDDVFGVYEDYRIPGAGAAGGLG